MNRTCEDVLRNLDGHLDRDLPAETSLELAQHLQDCPGCSQELEAKKSMRNRLKTAVQTTPTPQHLETRIRARIRAAERPSVWRLRLAPVAAAVVICLGAVIAYQLGHLRLTSSSQESYIASISSRVAGIMRIGLGDHVHCAVFRKFPKNPPTLQEMAEKVEPEYRGLVALVKDQVPGDFRILMAHHCRYQGRKFVHLALKNDSKLLSLVITRKSGTESFRADELAPVLAASEVPVYRTGVQRFEIAGFESEDHLAFVVSDLPQQRNLEIMATLAPAVESFLRKLEG